MDTLLESLRFIEVYPGCVCVDDKMHILYEGTDLVVVSIMSRIEMLARDVLLVDRDECDWTNIRILKINGFDVKPTKVDDHGWVIGGIHTKKGIVTYIISGF